MRNYTLSFSMVVALAAATLPNTTKAQVFIADTNARDILNDLIPGIVDGAGIMDTLHPGIAALDTASVSMSDSVDMVFLTGLEFLDAVTELRIHGQLASEQDYVLQVDAIPPGVSTLKVFPEDGTVNLPELPAGVRVIHLDGHHIGDMATVNIAGMPDSLDQILINQFMNVAQWPDTPYVQQLSMNSTSGGMSLGHIEAAGAAISLVIDPIGFLSSIHAPTLYVDGCVIPEGLIWPEGIRKLDLWSSSYEGTWGTFPQSLDSLTLDYVVGCMEWLPDGLSYFLLHYYQPEYDCFPNWPSSLPYIDLIAGDTLFPGDVEFCSVLNTNCPGAWPGVSGQLLMDVNLNGQCDPGEPVLPQAVITMTPSDHMTGCDATGFWEIGVEPGSYTITPSSTYPYFQSITPAQHTANLPSMGDTDVQNDFAVTLIPDMQDMRAHFYSEPPRPGFDNRLYLTCENYGTVPMDAELTLSFTADQTWVGSSVAPTSQTATTASWQLNAMAVGGSQQITVDLNTAAGVPLGTPVEYTVNTLPTSSDQTPTDNVIVFPDTVVGSYDPNDKLLSPARLSPEEVQGGTTPITYTIRFQNTGTFLAERVVIVDTLPAGLQPQSVEFLSSSHPCHWYVLDGVLHFIHEGINLPDSTNDEPGSHGYVQFRILPDADLVDGETVTNIAHIVFDFNEPIITPPAVFSVDIEAGIIAANGNEQVMVHPNPVHDQLRVSLPVDMSGKAPFSIQDPTGRTVLSGLTADRGLLDVSTLRDGVYVLRVRIEDRMASVRFVKR